MKSWLIKLKKPVAVSIIVLFSFATLSGSSLADSKSEGTFEELYPTPFLQTTTGTVSVIVGSAIIVYFTAGTTAGPVIAWVGTHIASLASFAGATSITGTCLSALSGAAVLNALGDVAVGFAFEGAVSAFPKNYEKYSLLKIKIPEKGNEEVREIIENLNEIIDKFNESDVDPEFFKITMVKYHRDALQILEHIEKTSENPGQDFLLKAIIEYNMAKYEECERSLNLADSYLTKNSVSCYIRSLLSLVKGDYKTSIKHIKKAIEIEPDALIPYILYAQIMMDNSQYYQALKVAETGLEKADSENFQLLLMAANLNFYHFNNYEKSLDLYKEALSNISINVYEAECKLMIAKSYRYLGNERKAQKWLEKALEEVEENPAYAKSIRKAWKETNNSRRS